MLGYWGENKTSYQTKEALKTKVVGDENLGKVQDGVAEGVGGQLSSGGLLGGVGDATSKQGMNRAEGAQLEHGDKPQGMAGQAQEGAQGVAGGVQKGLGGVTNTLTGGGGEKK